VTVTEDDADRLLSGLTLADKQVLADLLLQRDRLRDIKETMVNEIDRARAEYQRIAQEAVDGLSLEQVRSELETWKEGLAEKIEAAWLTNSPLVLLNACDHVLALVARWRELTE
jgi:hypothetical protein